MPTALIAPEISPGIGPKEARHSGTGEHVEREQVTVQLVRQSRHARCPAPQRAALRDAAVRLNLPFAYRLAHSYQHRGETIEDLRQVAALALVKAVDGYDPERGHSFTAYATPTITGEIKRHFRDRMWSVHVPRPLRDLSLQVTRTGAELAQRLGRYPSAAEIAAELGVPQEQVDATSASFSAYRADSLNRPCGGDSDAAQLQDLLGATDAALDSAGDRISVRALVQALPPRQRYVIDRYFLAGCSQAQIADALGTSQMSVCRLLKRSLEQLRERWSASAGDRASGVTVRTYQAAPGCVIAAVVGTVDGHNVTDLRRLLVDAVVSAQARTVVIDLRRMSSADPCVAGVLLAAYRTGGSSRTRICVVNAALPLFDILRRAGLDRLFPCRAMASRSPIGSRTDERDAAARSVSEQHHEITVTDPRAESTPADRMRAEPVHAAGLLSGVGDPPQRREANASQARKAPFAQRVGRCTVGDRGQRRSAAALTLTVPVRLRPGVPPLPPSAGHGTGIRVESRQGYVAPIPGCGTENGSTGADRVHRRRTAAHSGYYGEPSGRGCYGSSGRDRTWPAFGGHRPGPRDDQAAAGPPKPACSPATRSPPSAAGRPPLPATLQGHGHG